MEKDIDEIVARMYGISTDEERTIDEALKLCGNRFSKDITANRADDVDEDG